MSRAWRGLFLVLALLVPPAHRGWSQSPPSRLTVFAAASLTESFTEIARVFEQRHPRARVELQFAGSQRLVVQLLEGAPAGVFAAADTRWMAVARDSGLIISPPRVFARNLLVVVIPTANPARIEGLRDLARPGIKLVLASAAVPAGRYARQLLEHLAGSAGFDAEYARRALANVVSEEHSVRGVVAKVQLGEADAGVVYATDAAAPTAPAVRRIAIPDDAQVIAEYPIALVARSALPVAARRFLDLVISPEGQAILAKYGFLRGGS
jgi:molybdate transport system substrate-binding protein